MYKGAEVKSRKKKYHMGGSYNGKQSGKIVGVLGQVTLRTG